MCVCVCVCVCIFFSPFSQGAQLLGHPVCFPAHQNKHAYSNILKTLQPKEENFQIKHSDIFYIFAQNIDCGYSLEPPR